MCGTCCSGSKITTSLLATGVVVLGSFAIMQGTNANKDNENKNKNESTISTPTIDDQQNAPVSGDATITPTSYQPEGEMSPDQMLAFFKDWAAPVEEHALLAKMAGTWTNDAKFWMAPDAPPTVSKGKSEEKLVMDGRFLIQHYTMGDFMGMPFEGMGIVGYDKIHHAYTTTWIDNFGTRIMTMTGSYDEQTKTITWEGISSTPMGDMPAKHLLKFIDDDHMLLEFYDPDPANDGEFVKVGQIHYTRSDDT